MKPPTDVEFRVIPAVRVEINHPDRKESLGASPEALDFMRWCMANDKIGFRGCSTGPTGLVQFFEVEDAEVIREYLASKGYTEA